MDGSDGLEREVVEGDLAVAWIVSRSDVLGIDRGPLPDAMWDGLELGLGSDPTQGTGCGRCLTVATRAPWLVTAGELCPIPTFAREIVISDGPGLESLRTNIRLSLPGMCECPIPEKKARASLPKRILAAPDSAIPFEVVVSSSTSFGVVNESIAWVRTPTGDRQRAWPFDAKLNDAAMLPDGKILAALRDGDTPSRARLVLLGDDLETHEDLGPALLDVNAIAFDPTSRLVVLGGFSPSTSRLTVAVCDTDPFACFELDLGGLRPLDDNISRLTVREDGAVMAAGNASGALFLEGLLPPSERPRLVADAHTEGVSIGRLVGTTRSVRWKFVQLTQLEGHFRDHMIYPDWAGDTFAACRNPERDIIVFDSSGDFLSTLITPTAIFEPRGAQSCESVLRDPRSDSKVLAISLERHAASCDTTGCSEWTPIQQILRIDRYVSWVRRDPRRMLAYRPDASLFVGTSTASMSLVYGPQTPKATVASIVNRNDELWVFRSDGEISVSSGSPPAESRTLGRAGVLGPVYSVARDSARDGFLVVHGAVQEGCSERVSALSRLSVEGDVSPVDLPEPCLGIAEAAEVAPDAFLLAGSNARLYVLDGDSVGEVELSWDDPTTSALESGAIECPPQDDWPPGFSNPWRGIGGRLGAGFAARCNLTLFRVDALARPPTATRLVIDPEAVRDIQPAAFNVSCADVATIGAESDASYQLEIGLMIRVRPGTRPAARDLVPIDLTEDHENDLAASSGGFYPIRSHGLTALVGDESSLVPVFRNSLHRVGTKQRVRLGSYVFVSAAAVAVDGSVVIGTIDGSLLMIPPE